MSQTALIVAQDGVSQLRHFLVAASRRWAWSMVLKSRHGAAGVRLLDLLIESVLIEVVPVDFAQAKFACRASADCGKGPRPAGLNYGDCFVYALAHELGNSGQRGEKISGKRSWL